MRPRIVVPEIDPLDETAVDLRVPEKGRDAGFDPVRVPVVVGVEAGNKRALGAPESGIAGGAGTAVFLPDECQPLAIAGGDVSAIVGRTVIDDDDLDRPIALGIDAVQGFAEEAGAIEYRHDATDDRRRG